MAKQLFKLPEETRHNGFCEHLSKVSPDTLIMVRSNMWDGDHVCIARFAEQPWDALREWLTIEGSYVEWYVLQESYIN